MDTKNDRELKANEKGNHSLTSFKIHKELIENLKRQSITSLFEIQAKSFDIVYEGKDFVGRARTGQGKTLAFVLPVMSKILNSREDDRSLFRARSCEPLVLVLCPVRELAAQVAKVFEETCRRKISVCTVFGGVPYAKQQTMLSRGAEVVIGTCGRVKDLLQKGYLRLSSVKFVVLDEVDEMLNIGFADDVEHILSQVGKESSKEKKNHQVLLFSATLPKWVHKIARKYLDASYEEIDLVGDLKLQTSRTIKHCAICSHFTERDQVLSRFLEANLKSGESAIIFAERKKDCNALAQGALKKLSCRLLHGDIDQRTRTETIEGFRQGRFSILVATDVAARGINVPSVSLVVQLEPPPSHETYVHRSGRTGRAGAEGRSVLFYSPAKGWAVEEIERKAKIIFERISGPSPDFLLEKSFGEFQRMSETIPKGTRALLKPYVEKILEGEKTKQHLAAALVLITGGADKLSHRSMLCGTQNLVTVTLSSDKRSDRLTYWRACKDVLGSEIANSIRHMTIFKDQKGAVFDISEQFSSDIIDITEEKYSNSLRGKIKLEITKEMPRLDSFAISSKSTQQTNGFRRYDRGKRRYGRNRGRPRTNTADSFRKRRKGY